MTELTKTDEQSLAVVKQLTKIVIRGISAKIANRLDNHLTKIYTDLHKLEKQVEEIKKKVYCARQKRMLDNIVKDVLTKFKGYSIVDKTSTEIYAAIREKVNAYIIEKKFPPALMSYYIDINTSDTEINEVNVNLK